MNRIGIMIGLIVLLILIGIVFADILNYYGKIVATINVSEWPKWIQTTYDDFNTGIKDNVVITNNEGGEVQLAKLLSLDQSQTSQNSDSNIIQGDYYEAQTFVAGMSGNLVGIAIRAKRSGSQTKALIVELRDTTQDDKPGNNILASAQRNDISTEQEYDFTFTSPAIVIAGNKYSIVIRQEDGGVDNYSISYQDSDVYTYGKRFTSSNSGSTWTEQTNDDIYFKTYVENYATSGTLESQVFDSNSSLTKWKKIFWDANIFDGTSVKFQIATNNDGTTWNFKGPDGSDSTYYTTSGSDIWNGHDNTRYIKFKAFLETSNISITPILKEVIIFYLSD